ncbi:MAG TPA: sensor histidine kinase [Acidiferrobacteraceae bacterium]|nr:sensor histidine kinase [Acidiferrobacteraceae bacterium]
MPTRRFEDKTFRDNSGGFLPDFCRGETTINVVIIAQLLAIIVTLVSQRLSANVFKDLLIISLFVQWVALSTTAALCISRPYLEKLPSGRALMMAYLVMLTVALLISELMVWVMWGAGWIASARPEWYLYYHVQNFTIAAIVDALALRYFLARHQFKQSAHTEERTRMELLKYRIRPHFLFNSMNIIASLTQHAPDKAEAAIEDMADLFRLMLDESKNLVPLVTEVAVAKKYLALEKLRLENRLSVNWQVGDIPRTAKLPVLMLQLLLENAIQFGIETLSGGGEITIKLDLQDDLLQVNISNPISQDQESADHQDDNAALDNIRLRLSGHYGTNGSLGTKKENGLFTVTVTLPAFGGAE